jgi:hypothetical protein
LFFFLYHEPYLIMKKSFPHIISSISLYLIFAGFDIYFTLQGLNGDLNLEGNPIIKYWMKNYGLLPGLIAGKSIVFLAAFLFALITFTGIKNKSNWVYLMALTAFTRNYMKKKQRYWVAFLPIYFIALSQGMAALCWVWLLYY